MPRHAVWLVTPSADVLQRQVGSRTRHLVSLITEGKQAPAFIRALPGWDRFVELLSDCGLQQKPDPAQLGNIIGLVVIDTPVLLDRDRSQPLTIQEQFLIALENGEPELTMVHVIAGVALRNPVAVPRGRRHCTLLQLADDVVAQLNVTEAGDGIDAFLNGHGLNSRPVAAMQCWSPLANLVVQQKWQAVVLARNACRSVNWPLNNVWPPIARPRKRQRLEEHDAEGVAQEDLADANLPPAPPQQADVHWVEDSAASERSAVAPLQHLS